MRNILLISEDKIKTLTNINDNTFGKWLTPSIIEAQSINLQSIIGSCLYNQIVNLVETGNIGLEENVQYKDLLDNEIQDFLIYQTIVNLIPLVNVKIANFGSPVSNDEHIQTLSQGNIDLLRNYYQGIADVFQKRLQDYLLCHKDEFPELSDCACCNCTIKPNLHSNTNMVGIWLGGLQCHK